MNDLDPELRALFDAESKYDDMPDDAPAHILAKVGAGLLLIPVATTLATAGKTAAAAGARATVWEATKRVATWVAFGTGAVAGVAGHATVEHVRARLAQSTKAPIAVVAPAPVQVTAPSASPSPSASSSTMTIDLTIPVSSGSASRSQADKPDDQDVSLAAERAQLEIARTALGRGNASSALSVLQADAKQRPNGRLAEERDSMMVQALSLSGQPQQAHARALTFARKYPHSLFLPMVQAAGGTAEPSGY